MGREKAKLWERGRLRESRGEREKRAKRELSEDKEGRRGEKELDRK